MAMEEVAVLLRTSYCSLYPQISNIIVIILLFFVTYRATWQRDAGVAMPEEIEHPGSKDSDKK